MVTYDIPISNMAVQLYVIHTVQLTRVRNCLTITSALTHWGRDKMAAISQTTYSNAFSWMKLYEFRLRFH